MLCHYYNFRFQKLAIQEWCKGTVLSCIKWISEWAESQDFDLNLEESLVALVWLNKGKLYRLAAALMKDSSYNYLAVDTYTTAIDTLSGPNKRKLSPMSINIKCDRLDLCILIVENAYDRLSSDNGNCQESVLRSFSFEYLINISFHVQIFEMNKAIGCADKIHRLESSMQSVQVINMKLTSLRLRINFVRYYLNVMFSFYSYIF